VCIAILATPSFATSVAGLIDTDTTWDEPYYDLTGEVQIQSGATLTIMPNVEVYTPDPNWELQVLDGTLVATDMRFTGVEPEIQVYSNGNVSLLECDITSPAQNGSVVFYPDAQGTVHHSRVDTFYVQPSNDLTIRNNSIRKVYAGDGSGDIDLAYNWWGTTDTSVIDSNITDHADKSSKARVVYEPILTDDPVPAQTHVLAFGVDQGANLAGDWAARSVADVFYKFDSVVTAESYALDYDAANPTKAYDVVIRDNVAAMRSKIKSGDTLVFFLTGHGTALESGDENGVLKQVKPFPPLFWWNTGDEYVALHQGGNFITDDDLTRAFMKDDGNGNWVEDEHWANVNKLFIIDACFSGGFWGNTAGDDGDLNRLSNVALIAAAPEYLYAPRARAWPPAQSRGVGALTISLLAALNHMQDDIRITYDGLYHRILALQKRLYDENGPSFGIMGDEQYWTGEYEMPFVEPFSAYSPGFEMTLSNAIPEPTTMLAVGLSIASLSGYVRRRKKLP